MAKKAGGIAVPTTAMWVVFEGGEMPSSDIRDEELVLDDSEEEVSSEKQFED